MKIFVAKFDKITPNKETKVICARKNINKLCHENLAAKTVDSNLIREPTRHTPL